MSDEYLAAIGRADGGHWHGVEAVNQEETVAIVTSDHGGHESTHGTEMDEDMTIPWVIAGPPVSPGRNLQQPSEHHRQPDDYCRFAGSGHPRRIGRTSGAGSPRITN